jgi:hypothetical protein
VKSESWLIIQVGVVLALLTALSFFKVPVYEKGAWAGLVVFSSAFSGLLGYKFGRSMPSQAGDVREGQASTSTTTVETVSPDLANPKPDA